MSTQKWEIKCAAWWIFNNRITHVISIQIRKKNISNAPRSSPWCPLLCHHTSKQNQPLFWLLILYIIWASFQTLYIWDNTEWTPMSCFFPLTFVPSHCWYSIPLCEHLTMSLAVLLLINIWVVSPLRHLVIKLLWNLVHIFVDVCLAFCYNQ